MRLWRTLLLVAWVSASWCLVHAKQLAVVTDPANTTASLSAADLIKIFRAHTHSWPDGKPVIIVLRDPTSNGMQLLLRKVFHMTPEQATLGTRKPQTSFLRSLPGFPKTLMTR